MGLTGQKRSRRTPARPKKSRRTGGSAPARRRLPMSRMSLLPIKRTFYLENWQPSTATTSGFWRYYNFSLSTLPSNAEITALFDQYRINGIKVTFRPRYDGFMGNDTVDTTLPGVTNLSGTRVHIINDPASTVSPSGIYASSNLNGFMEQGSVRTYQGNRDINVYFKPKVDNALNAFNGAQRVRAPYIQTTLTGVSHNGFHVFMQDANFAGFFGQSFDIYVTYYMMCRGLK